jgi:ankyrin repeat protein
MRSEPRSTILPIYRACFLSLAGADVNARDRNGYTPLGHRLTRGSHKHLEMTLLSLPGVDLEDCGPDGVSALQLAVRSGRSISLRGMIGAEVRWSLCTLSVTLPR